MESSSAGFTMENKGKNEMPTPQGRTFTPADASSFLWQYNKTDERISKFILFLLVHMKVSSLLSIDH